MANVVEPFDSVDSAVNDGLDAGKLCDHLLVGEYGHLIHFLGYTSTKQLVINES